MSFCDHCDGQRFDRAQVLRALRATRQQLRQPATACSAERALSLAIEAIRALDIPHPHWSEDEDAASVVVH